MGWNIHSKVWEWIRESKDYQWILSGIGVAVLSWLFDLNIPTKVWGWICQPKNYEWILSSTNVKPILAVLILGLLAVLPTLNMIFRWPWSIKHYKILAPTNSTFNDDDDDDDDHELKEAKEDEDFEELEIENNLKPKLRNDLNRRNISIYFTTLRQNEFYPRLLDEIIVKAQKYGLKTRISLSVENAEPGSCQHDPNIHLTSFVKTIESANSNSDVLVVIPPSPQNYEKIHEKMMKNKDLKVIALDIKIPDGLQNPLLGMSNFRIVRIDNKKAGQLAATQVCNYCRNNRIDINNISWILCKGSFHDRHKYFKKSLSTECKIPEDRLNIQEPHVPFNRREAKEIIINHLRKNIDFRRKSNIIIFCPNDNITYSVHDACCDLKRNGKLKKENIKIVGFDAVFGTKLLIDNKDEFLIGCVDHRFDYYSTRVISAVIDLFNQKANSQNEHEILIEPGFYKKW